MTTPHEKSPVWPEEGKAASRLLEREKAETPQPAGAFAQQEAALQRMGAQIRAANGQIEGIKQRLQAQISPKKR
jgi:hypothetical protein